VVGKWLKSGWKRVKTLFCGKNDVIIKIIPIFGKLMKNSGMKITFMPLLTYHIYGIA